MANWILKNKKLIIIASAVFLFGLIFISVPIGVFPDSTVYTGYIKIFQGVAPISSWDMLRGPSFPFMIFLFITFLGGPMVGLLIGAYIIFLGMVYVLASVIKRFVEELKLNKRARIITYIFFSLAVVLNPIIFGYFHAVLTEYITMFMAVISCILAWKWMKVDFISSKAKYIGYTLAFSLIMVFMWFVKQPYLTVSLFPWLIAGILELTVKFNWRNLLQRMATLCVGVTSLVLGIVVWQSFLGMNGVNVSSSSGSSGFIGYGLMSGVSNGRLIKESKLTDVEVDKDSYLNDEEKQKIKDALDDSDFTADVWVLYSANGQKIVDKIPVYYSSTSMPLGASVKLWTEITSSNPLLALDSYASNYLASSGAYGYRYNESNQFAPTKDLGFHGHENYSIGLLFLTYPSNMSDWTRERASELGLIQIENQHARVRQIVYKIWGRPYIALFTLCSVLLPLLLTLTIVFYSKERRKKKSKSQVIIRLYELVIILIGLSFTNMLFNAFFGALMDRYAYVTWPAFSLAMVLWLAVIMSRGKFRIRLDSLIASAKNRRKLPR